VLQINLAFGAFYIWDFTVFPPFPGWNAICEADIGFKLPNNTRLFYGRRPPIKRRRSSSGINPLHRRERLELFRNIEGLMDV